MTKTNLEQIEQLLGELSDAERDQLRAMINGDGPEGTGPLRRMYADVMFLNPDKVDDAASDFIHFGFDFELQPDRIDEGGPTQWARVAITTRLDDDGLISWISEIAGPYDGYWDEDLSEDAISGNVVPVASP